jgi:hypothetical protein
MSNQKIKLEKCQVGMFKLPGLVVQVEGEEGESLPLTEETFKEIEDWSLSNNCGKPMTRKLWSFKNEKQRDVFILKWS